MCKVLAFDDVKRTAVRLGVDPCFLFAVAAIESSGKGFLPDGRVVVRFEKHVFLRELKKRSLPLGAAQALAGCGWATLDKARAIHEEAALCSASFGLFQIMGFNHKLCGYAHVTDFVHAMQKSAALQLEAVCSFLASGNMLADIKALNWQAFARQYNGPGYAANQYDLKLKKEYEKCKNAVQS